MIITDDDSESVSAYGSGKIMRHEPNHVKRSHCTVANNGLITDGSNNNKNVQHQTTSSKFEKPVVNVQLQKKLDKCFGLFDDVRKYLISKDDASSYNHVHMVGVTPGGYDLKNGPPHQSSIATTETNIVVDRNVPSSSLKPVDAISDSVMATRTENPVTQCATNVSIVSGGGINNVQGQTTIPKKPSEKAKAWNLNTFMECMLSPVKDEYPAKNGLSEKEEMPSQPQLQQTVPSDSQDQKNKNRTISKCQNESKACTSSFNKSNFEDDRLNDMDSTRSILKKSRLSPLLSPIREFPSVEYKNGLPSLTCRLPLSLVKNVPQLPRRPPQNSSRPPAYSNCKENEFEQQDCKFPSQKFDHHADLRCSNGDESTSVISSSDQMPQKHRTKGSNTSATRSTNPKGDRLPPRATNEITLEKGAKCTDNASSNNNRNSDLPLKMQNMGDVESDSSRQYNCSSTNDSLQIGDVFRDSKDFKAQNLEKTEVKNATNFDIVGANISSVMALAGGFKVKRKLEIDAKTNTCVSPKRAKHDSSFIMAAAPEKALPLDFSVKDYKFYMAKAKELKHQADRATDRVLRIAIYLESICYFFITGYWMEKTLPKESQIPFNMIKDTRDLLGNVVEKKLPQLSELNERLQALFSHKLEILALKLQALLMCHMFSMRHSVAYANYRHITDYHKNTLASKDRPSSVHGCCSSTTSSMAANAALSVTATAPPGPSSSSSLAVSDHSSSCLSSCSGVQAVDHLSSFSHDSDKHVQKATLKQTPSLGVGGVGAPTLLAPAQQQQSAPMMLTSSTPSPTPSPASSTGSSSHSLPPGLIAIPQHVETLYKQQLSHLHNLLMAHHHWQAAESKLKQHDLNWG
uniref:AF4/FMR2 family member lilli n=1 Tax=Romanomermis culicivorax TaxID=13658 RepID=A0A915IBX0_ROMCU